jgi:hypothetical protein
LVVAHLTDDEDYRDDIWPYCGQLKTATATI